MIRDDLIDTPVTEEQVGIDTGAKLADISGAQQQPVACDLGIGRSFAEGRDEELRPAVHAILPDPMVRGVVQASILANLQPGRPGAQFEDSEEASPPETPTIPFHGRATIHRVWTSNPLPSSIFCRSTQGRGVSPLLQPSSPGFLKRRIAMATSRLLHILNTDLLAGNEVLVRFSDGTSAIYDGEELEKLRPRRKQDPADRQIA